VLVEGSRRRVAIEACHYHSRCSDKHPDRDGQQLSKLPARAHLDAVRRFEGTVNQVMGDNQRQAMH
jgi:hypothetical protein